MSVFFRGQPSVIDRIIAPAFGAVYDGARRIARNDQQNGRPVRDSGESDQIVRNCWYHMLGTGHRT